LVYVDVGQGSVVLILHGSRSIEGQWENHIDVLVHNGYRVVYPHRAGRGESDPHEAPLTLTLDARDAFTLLDHLEIKSVVATGHSQGAFVAIQMLLHQPHRLRGIISVDSAAFGTLKPETERLGIDRFDPATRALYEKHKATLAKCDRLWEYPSDFNVARVVRAVKLRRDNPDLCDRTTQKPDPEDRPVPPGKFCHVPLLVFAAGRGKIRQTDPEAQALQQCLPSDRARLVVTDSGHGVHEEQPELFNREILAFLDSLH